MSNVGSYYFQHESEEEIDMHESEPEETNDEDIDTAEPLEPPRNNTNVVMPTDKELGFCKKNDDCVDASYCCSNLSCVDPSICLHGKKLQQDVCSFDFECMSRCCYNNTCLHFLNCYKNCSSNADCTKCHDNCEACGTEESSFFCKACLKKAVRF